MALPKKNRLKNKKDFESLFKNGKVARGRFLLIKFMSSPAKITRVGVVVPLKVAKTATARNKIKRRLSELLGRLTYSFKAPIDIVVIIQNPSIIEEADSGAKELESLILKQKLV